MYDEKLIEFYKLLGAMADEINDGYWEAGNHGDSFDAGYAVCKLRTMQNLLKHFIPHTEIEKLNKLG